MLSQPPAMGAFLDKHISSLCTFKIAAKNNENHCAHFVSHVMGYDFLTTCKNQSFEELASPSKGACLRVNEIFNRANVKGDWESRSICLRSCLIYATISSNVTQSNQRLSMGGSSRKHVGIFTGGQVWHYSNTKDKVVADSVTIFMAKFRAAYQVAGTTVNFYYSEFLK